MKKIVALLFVVMAAVAVKAQVYVGGTASFWHNDDADLTTFTLAPEVGYELNHKWSIGASIMFSHAKTDHSIDLGPIEVEGKTKVNAFAFAPYARYNLLDSKVVRLFIEGGLGLSSVKVKGYDSEAGFEIGLRPGISIKLNKNFSFITKYGFLGYRDDYMLNDMQGYGFALSSEDLSIGFHYAF